MNFLAHLHLSPDDPDIQLGNGLADLVKGPDVAKLPAAVQVGVHLHRRIDGFTDSHPIVGRCVRRIGDDWGLFSGIILDIYFDHLLARDWAEWSAEPLRDFANRMYGVLSAGLPLVDGEARDFLAGFIESDRLAAYATVEGITETLARTARRIAKRMPKRALPLQDAVPQLQAQDGDITADFRAFYPLLQAHARSGSVT